MPDLDDTAVDARLRALFAADAPSARDPMFSAAVMARIARRQFVGDVVLHSGVTALGALVLWALWPSLQPLAATLGRELAPVAACLTLAVVALVMAGGRRVVTFGFEHD